MTTITAKIVLDSVSPQGIRLTTMELRYPRIIHSELMTHRVFSRNARSSRAVPVAKIIQEVIDDPFVPLVWGKNQKGMQADVECDMQVYGDNLYGGREMMDREKAWRRASRNACYTAQAFADAGYHKQIVNRLLEPFAHIDVLVSATSWANWFALRNHPAAEPHIQMLASAMKVAMQASGPKVLQPGEWHLPYAEPDWDVTEEKQVIYDWRRASGSTEDYLSICTKLSVARCARISYKPFDGNASIEAELKRYDDLVGSTPLHASPTEHQATPDEFSHYRGGKGFFEHEELAGNFGPGWIQFRKTIAGEFVPDILNKR